MNRELRWAQEAADDLEKIADYLFQNTPARAEELVRQIYDAPHTLLTFPFPIVGGPEEKRERGNSCCPRFPIS